MSQPYMLVAHPDQIGLVDALLTACPPAGIVNTSRRRLRQAIVPVYGSVQQAVEAQSPAWFLFVSPYPSLVADLNRAAASGIHSGLAGPPPCSQDAWARLTKTASATGAHLHIVSRNRYLVHHPRLVREARDPDFGLPVYYRHIAQGGDSLLSAWWTLWRLKQAAEEALGSPARTGYVAVRRIGRACQASLTLNMFNEAKAHVMAAATMPCTEGEVFLLGTGGSIAYSGQANRPQLYGRDGGGAGRGEESWITGWVVDMRSGDGDSAWSADEHRRAQTLLQTMRTAARTGRLTTVGSPRA